MSFGDGSDGDVVISVNTTLTRDMNYNNLTIDAGAMLYPDGYIIYVADRMIVNGIIDRAGNSGSVTYGGVGLPTKSVGGSSKGGDCLSETVGGDGENVVNGIAGSNGGDGRDHFIRPQYHGGDGGITENVFTVVNDDSFDLVTNALNRLGGAGGGAGAYMWDMAGFHPLPGGGGGGGGGVVLIYAKDVLISSTGSITVKGGESGYGVGGYYELYHNDGGSGGGGCIVLFYSTMVNNGVFDVSFGASHYGGDGTDGTLYLFETAAAAAAATKTGRSSHYSTGASIPGGIKCGMGKRRR